MKETSKKWAELFDWTIEFRQRYNITAKQLLELFNLPSYDGVSIYLYPDYYCELNIDDKESLDFILFNGLLKARENANDIVFNFKLADTLSRAEEVYQFNRDKLRKVAVYTCFFEMKQNVLVIDWCKNEKSNVPDDESKEELIKIFQDFNFELHLNKTVLL